MSKDINVGEKWKAVVNGQYPDVTVLRVGWFRCLVAYGHNLRDKEGRIAYETTAVSWVWKNNMIKRMKPKKTITYNGGNRG